MVGVRDFRQHYSSKNISMRGGQKKNQNIIKREKEDLNGSSRVLNNKSAQFSYRRAGANFVNGLISPFTAIINHPVGSLAMIAGMTLLLSQFAVLTPVVLTLGIGLSALQLAKGGSKFIIGWKNNKPAEMENAFVDIGCSASSFTLSSIGIKQQYKAFSLKSGISKTFKDSVNLIKEIIAARKIPTQDIVALVVTSHPIKLKDTITAIKGVVPSKSKILQVTDDLSTSQVNIRPLKANEELYGHNYFAISKGKAFDYSTKETLSAKIQNTGTSIDGKTIEQAFPGRKLLIVTTDVGFEMPLNSSKLPMFKTELKNNFNMSDADIDGFIGSLAKKGDNFELLGIRTHRNLDVLGKYLKNNGNTNKKLEAERILAEILKKINLGGEYTFNSVSTVRNVLSNKVSRTNYHTTTGKITDKPSNLNSPFYDNGFIVDSIEVVASNPEIDGLKLSQAPREFVSTSQAVKASFNQIQKDLKVKNSVLSSALATSYNHYTSKSAIN